MVVVVVILVLWLYSLRIENLHELLLGAIGTEDIAFVGNETLANEWTSAHCADEAVIMPVAILERDKAGSSDACNRLSAGSAPLGEQFSIAVRTIGFLFSWCKPLSSKTTITVGTTEAFPMPWLITVCHTTRLNDLVTLDAPGGELLFIASCAVDIIIPWNERSCSNWVLAHHATEAFLMPLVTLIFHLLCSGSEDLGTSIAPWGKGSIVASGAVNLLSFRAKRFVYERHTTLGTQEALFMPMLLLVWQILGVDSDRLGTLITGVGEYLLVTPHAIRMLITEDVSLAGQGVITLPAAKVAGVPILIHGFSVFPTEDQIRVSEDTKVQCLKACVCTVMVVWCSWGRQMDSPTR
jgi:hypothetical protein